VYLALMLFLSILHITNEGISLIFYNFQKNMKSHIALNIILFLKERVKHSFTQIPSPTSLTPTLKTLQ